MESHLSMLQNILSRCNHNLHCLNLLNNYIYGLHKLLVMVKILFSHEIYEESSKSTFHSVFESNMASMHIQEIKNGDYFITSLPLPQINHPSESQYFSLMGNYWNVKVVYEAIHRKYEAYIELKINLTGSRPNFQIDFGSLDIFSDDDEPVNYNLEPINVNSESFCFEYLSIDGIRETLPPDYNELDDVLKYTIKFSFDNRNTLQFKLRDKSVQTESYLNGPSERMIDFSKMLLSTDFSDVEIKCGERSYKAHKCVLSSRSDVLKANLQSGMRESRTGIVETVGIDAGIFEDFLKYLYTDSLPDDLCLDKAEALYEVGDKYAVSSLVMRCAHYIRDNLSPENFLRFFALADLHFDITLKEGVKAYVLEEKVYRDDEHWLPFCEKYPQESIALYKQVLERRKKRRKIHRWSY